MKTKGYEIAANCELGIFFCNLPSSKEIMKFTNFLSALSCLKAGKYIYTICTLSEAKLLHKDYGIHRSL